jgi:exopolyphosphatase/guanosine-5'-triphosphate,3'-diphosphate pyrophosphatase
MSASVDGPVAALDCGTNSTRVLVADRDGRALERLMRITRLGEGVDATRKLDPAAIDRTTAVLGEFREVMDRHGVTAARLVATSAVRDAANGDEFLAAARAVTGVEPELLSGDEEGRLAYLGATAELPADGGDTVVLDIGGGSTEVVVGRQGAVSAVSLDLGCVRLTERHLQHDPPTAAELFEARSTVAAALDDAVGAVPVLASLRPARRLLGLAGTVTTISALEQQLADYDRARIHHSVLPAGVVDGWCATLAGETAAARRSRPGMTPGREDVILGGVLVLSEFMARFRFDRCIVSEADILDGLVETLRAA